MKSTTITATIALIFALSTPSYGADKAHAPGDTMPRAQSCKLLDRLAESIMEARQKGAPMAEVMAIADTGSDKQLNAVLRSLAIYAYKTQRWETAKLQKEAITDFRSDVYLSCITAK